MSVVLVVGLCPGLGYARDDAQPESLVVGQTSESEDVSVAKSEGSGQACDFTADDITIDGMPFYEWNKKYVCTPGVAVMPSVSIHANGAEPIAGIDYQVKVLDGYNGSEVAAVEPGDYWLEITNLNTEAAGESRSGKRIIRYFRTYTPDDLANAEVTLRDVYENSDNLCPIDKVVAADGKLLAEGTDYTLAYFKSDMYGDPVAPAGAPSVAGNYAVSIPGKGSYTGEVTKTFKVVKGENPMTAKASKKTLKASKLKKGAVSFKPVTVKKAVGTVKYKSASAKAVAKHFKVNSKNGKVTAKKGTKKGSYEVKLTITAKGNKNYKSASKTLTVNVTVK